MYSILPQVKALGKKQKLCLYHVSAIFTEIKILCSPRYTCTSRYCHGELCVSTGGKDRCRGFGRDESGENRSRSHWFLGLPAVRIERAGPFHKREACDQQGAEVRSHLAWGLLVLTPAGRHDANARGPAASHWPQTATRLDASQPYPRPMEVGWGSDFINDGPSEAVTYFPGVF